MATSLFSQIACHRPISSWTKGLWWHRWRICEGSATWTHQGQPGHSCYWVPICQHWVLAMAPFTRVISQLSGQLQVDYIGPFLLWKGQHFVLTGIDIYSGYKFSFPVCSASGKTTICGLTECLPTIMLSHTAGLLIKDLTSQPKKCRSGPLLTAVTPLVWSNWLEYWNGLLKTQLLCRLCGNMWQGQGKAIHTVNQQPIYALFVWEPVSTDGISGGNGSGSTPSDPLATFLLPIPTSLCSAGLEVLTSKRGRLSLRDATKIHWTRS